MCSLLLCQAMPLLARCMHCEMWVATWLSILLGVVLNRSAAVPPQQCRELDVTPMRAYCSPSPPKGRQIGVTGCYLHRKVCMVQAVSTGGDYGAIARTVGINDIIDAVRCGCVGSWLLALWYSCCCHQPYPGQLSSISCSRWLSILCVYANICYYYLYATCE